MLVEELKNMGVSDVYFDEKYCYVYAKIPANTEKTNYTCNADSTCVPETTGIGFISHMDTSPEVSGEGVNPKIVKIMMAKIFSWVKKMTENMYFRRQFFRN